MNDPANLIDLATGLSPAECGRTGLSAHQHAGFELGWDYAHHRLDPPAPYADEASPLRNGLLAGRAAFGTRTLTATVPVRRWLQLRLHAWLRGRSVERVQVTPNFLQQIEVGHCPITRAALGPDDQSIDRVRDDAGYAAGNLVVMSRKANHAKGALGHCAVFDLARRVVNGQLNDPAGLGADAWMRVAVLCSFVEPLPHEAACRLPMRVLPPNRLRLFNPVQALQAFVSRQLLTPGWSQRISRFEALLPSAALRRDFKSFFMTLLPRVLEAGLARGACQARWAVEDAWRDEPVLERWTAFASSLTPLQCEALLTRAAARQLATTVIQPLTAANATDGWQLATRGYLPHAANVAASRRLDDRQQQLAW